MLIIQAITAANKEADQRSNQHEMTKFATTNPLRIFNNVTDWLTSLHLSQYNAAFLSHNYEYHMMCDMGLKVSNPNHILDIHTYTIPHYTIHMYKHILYYTLLYHTYIAPFLTLLLVAGGRSGPTQGDSAPTPCHAHGQHQARFQRPHQSKHSYITQPYTPCIHMFYAINIIHKHTIL